MIGFTLKNDSLQCDIVSFRSTRPKRGDEYSVSRVRTGDLAGEDCVCVCWGEGV